MLSIKETKSGGVAIIFSKEYASIGKAIYPSLASEVFRGESLPEPVKTKTLSDVKSNVERANVKREPLGTIKNPKLMLNVPKTTAGIPKDREEIRMNLHGLIKELCKSRGLVYSEAWTKAYRILYDSTGFDVYDKEVVIKKGKPNLLETVLLHGQGGELVRVLRTFLDKR